MKCETDDKYLQIFDKCIKIQLPDSNYYNYQKKPVFKNKLSVVQNEVARHNQSHNLESAPPLYSHRPEGGNCLHKSLHIMACG